MKATLSSLQETQGVSVQRVCLGLVNKKTLYKLPDMKVVDVVKAVVANVVRPYLHMLHCLWLAK